MNHVKNRMSERYQKDISERDLAEMGKLIYLGKCLHAGRVDEELSFAYVIYKNIPVKCLYKRTTKVKIVTVYPLDIEEYNFLISEEAIRSAIQLLQDNGYLVIKLGETNKV